MKSRCILTGLMTAILLLSIPAPFAAQAQDFTPAPVTISKDKVKYKGKTYFSHVVQESQTLYSIAKAYGVTVQEIYDANPDLTVLKKNAIILVPDKDAKGYKKPEVTQETPPSAQENAGRAAEEKVPYIEHIVKWNDTLSSLAEKYGVSEQVIIEFNHLESATIRKRQVLRIPTKDTPGEAAASQQLMPSEEVTPVIPEAGSDTLNQSVFDRLFTWRDSLAQRLIPPVSQEKRHVGLTMMLPFHAGEKVSENQIDFYCGVLMAIRDLSETETIGVDLHVFDTAGGINAQTISQESLAASDFILGPVSGGDLSKTLQLRPDTGIAVVSPLDQKACSLLENGAVGFIQAPTSYDVQYRDLVAWLKDDYAVGDKILLISEDGGNPGDFGTKVTAALNRSGLPCKAFSYTILQGRSITDRLAALFSTDHPNRIVIASENEAFVNDVVRNLIVLTLKKYNITLYAPAKFRNFETIEVESYHSLHMHVSTAYHIDYDSEPVRRFLLAYRAFFQAEPSRFSFQGYDLASYLIRMVSRYGGSWQLQLPQNPETLLQMRMEFERSGGSFVNKGTRRIVYDPDFHVRAVR